MKKKTLFFVLLCCIGLILWAGASFLGFAYIFKGAFFNSAVLSLFILFAMATSLWGMCKFCDPTKYMGQYSKAVLRHIFCWIVYIVVCVLSAIVINHGLMVTLTVRSDIQNKAQQEIKDLGVLFGDENVERSYLEWVKRQKESLAQSLSGSDEDVVELRVAELDDELTIQSGFNTLRENADDDENGFLGQCYYAVSNWTWWNVADYLDQLETNKTVYIEKVTECSQFCERTQNEPYQFSPKFNNENLSAQLIDPLKSGIGMGSIAFLLITQLLILLVYLSVYPFGVSKGRKWDGGGKKKSSHQYGGPSDVSEVSEVAEFSGTDEDHEDYMFNPE